VTTEHEEIRVGQLTIRFLIERHASAGAVAIFECEVPPSAKVPAAHSHDAYEETVYGLTGVTTFTVSGRPHEIAPGEALSIPRGVVHRFDNFHATDAKVLVIATPGILGPDYFREMATVVNAAVDGAPDPAAIAAVMRRHGLTPAP
jgi:quercetin dioxygenase-like cupin family protein